MKLKTNDVLLYIGPDKVWANRKYKFMFVKYYDGDTIGVSSLQDIYDKSTLVFLKGTTFFFKANKLKKLSSICSKPEWF